MRLGLPLVIAAVAGLFPPLVQAQEEPVNSFWPGLEKPASTDPTSSKIIDLHLKARGGLEAIKTVRSLLLEGILTEGKRDYKIKALYSPKGKGRFELSYESRGVQFGTIKASDGDQTWQRKLLPEIKRPSSVGGSEGQVLDLEARLPFLMLDHAGQGHVFAYVGKKDSPEWSAYRVHGWLASGLQIDILFDTKSFQIINYQYPYEIGGKEVLINLTPSKLKHQGKVWWEMEYGMTHRNKIFRRIAYEKVEINVPVRDSHFAKPEMKEFWLRGSRN